jgi:DNA polymerase-3 subunit gamma/tau
MGQALYRKWRPQTFDDVMGQEHIVRTLRNALRQGRIHHAYLLAGPRGTGKTTTARLLAKAVNCLAPVEERPCNACEICRAVNEGRLMDLIEIDAASNTGVDNVRELLEKVGFRPAQARLKVYVIDEVHMLSTAAFNALLKTLEEPPAYAHLILLATDADTLLPTVVSRSQHFALRPLSRLTVQQALQQRWEAALEVAERLARLSCGRLGWAVQALTDPQRRQQIDEAVLKWLTLLRQELPARFEAAAELAKDPVQLALVLEMWQLAWRDVLLLQTENAEGITYLEQEAALREVATSVTVGQTVNALKTLEQAQEALRRNANALLLTENLLLDLPTLR